MNKSIKVTKTIMDLKIVITPFARKNGGKVGYAGITGNLNL